MRILVVDDEPAVRESLRRALQLEGYEVALAGDGVEALDAMRANSVDAIVLDVSMPRLDGLETCRRLRSQGNSLPVLMLTARDEVADRVAGLDAGADDYVVKPFALEELLARLRALLRRAAPAEDGDVLRFADLELDPATREVRRSGDPIELTRTEFSLLELFLLNPRQVLTRLPPPQDRAGRQAAADPDGPRRRLRAARGGVGLTEPPGAEVSALPAPEREQ